MNGHGSLIVRHEHAAIGRGKFQDSVVGYAFKAGIVGALEINRRLTTADAPDNRHVQIGVREEADAHDPGFRNSSLAR
jgi:hypothetical protein